MARSEIATMGLQFYLHLPAGRLRLREAMARYDDFQLEKQTMLEMVLDASQRRVIDPVMDKD